MTINTKELQHSIDAINHYFRILEWRKKHKKQNWGFSTKISEDTKKVQEQ